MSSTAFVSSRTNLEVEQKSKSNASQLIPDNDKQYKQIPHYEVWIQFYPTKDQGLKEFLFQQYKQYCENISFQYCRTKMPGYSLMEDCDILQFGFIGLLQAIDSFDPYRGVSFETHSYRRIIGEIIDGLRSANEFPRIIAKIRRELRPLIEALSSKLCRAPDISELVEEYPRFHVNGVRIGELLKDRLVYVNVFNQLNEYSGSENDNGDKIDNFETVLFKHAKSNENSFSNIDRVDFIGQIFKRLINEDEKSIILYYYFNKLTIPKISGIMGLSESCISLKRISAIENLKHIARVDEDFRNFVFGG